MVKPYDKTTHDGKTVDQLTHRALLAVEERLGYELTIVQGSYNGGAGKVPASGGTHDGGGVVDLAPWDHENKVRALRAVGFAAWYRPELWRNGVRVWGPHIHAVLIGNAKLSQAAKDQVSDYYAGKDGLAYHQPDPTWRPTPIPVFQWASEVASFTVGTHNTHDEHGKPTNFADVVGFTEAVPSSIRAKFTARFEAWRDDRKLLVCKSQRSLVISLRKNLFRVTEKQYIQAHEGEAGVTPARGTYIIKAIHRPTGRKVAFVLEHRINAAFPPYVRGEGEFRAECWAKHQKLTLRMIRGLKQENYTVFAFGDLNTPPDVQGYAGHLTELGKGYDRLACSRDADLTNPQRLSTKGSDHHRIKAIAHL